MEKWLVTGGAGYIGSHIVRGLISSGNEVVVLDNFSTGKLSRIIGICEYVSLDCRDFDGLQRLFNEKDFVGVIHLAANKHARESARNPEKYWHNNVLSMLNLLRALKDTKVRKFILSSSCSVYGSNPMPQLNDSRSPISPYGRTKMVCEDMLKDFCKTLDIQWAILRYFNVIGCDQFIDAADDSDECLMPLLTKCLLSSTPISIFGDDYNTPDGTALRDYIDVRDLARAHTIIANKMHVKSDNFLVNVSSGKPISVQQVVKTLQEVSGMKFTVQIEAANVADPAAIWSPPSKELIQLGWTPKFEFLESVSAHWEHVVI